MDISFEYEKDTKNTIKFKELSDSPVIQSIYIQKSYLKERGYEKSKKISIKIIIED